MRKTLSVILSVVMVLSLFCVGASAAAPEVKNIGTADEFMAMVSGGNYALTADITLSASVAEFKGALDGQGHTITISGAPAFMKLAGSVKNLVLAGADVDAAPEGHQFGALAAFAPDELYVENVTNNVNITLNGPVKDAAGTASGMSAGGIVGETELYTKVIFVNCTNKGNITVKSAPDADATEDVECWAGGLCGHADTFVAQNCINEGDITTSSTFLTGPLGYSGGFCGRSAYKAGVNFVDIEFCVNKGDIYGSQGAGGMIGYAGVSSNNTQRDYDSLPYTVKACVNYGTITGHQYTGGMVGYMYTNGSNDQQTFSIMFNTNLGDIKGGRNNNASGGATAGWASDIISYSNSIFNELAFNIGAGTVSYHNEDNTSAPYTCFLGCSSANYENDEFFHDNYVADQNYYQWLTYSTGTEDNRHEFDWGVGEGKIVRTTADKLLSGEIANEINTKAETNAFYQTIGVDTVPLPFNSSKAVGSDGKGGFINVDTPANPAYTAEAAAVATTNLFPDPTEAPTAAPTAAPTEAPTDAPTEAPTDAPANTDAPETKPAEEKKGCKSSVACGLVILAVLGTAYVSKKH